MCYLIARSNETFTLIQIHIYGNLKKRRKNYDNLNKNYFIIIFSKCERDFTWANLFKKRKILSKKSFLFIYIKGFEQKLALFLATISYEIEKALPFT